MAARPQRVIAGIGDALLREYPDRAEPGGLAVQTALHATQLGHVGVAIARIGQDRAGDQLLQHLREANLAIDHIQSDPDLPTGRLTIRRIAGKVMQSISPRAAFDNLQWDFDLVDVAQQADAVIFSELGRREAQSRSIIKRFLAECRNSLRVFDLSSRSSDAVNRADARSGIEMAEVLVSDTIGLTAFVPGAAAQSTAELAKEILRGQTPSVVVAIEKSQARETFTVHTAEQLVSGKQSHDEAQHAAALIGLIHGLLSGWELAACLEMSRITAEHAAAHPREPLPQPVPGMPG